MSSIKLDIEHVKIMVLCHEIYANKSARSPAISPTGRPLPRTRSFSHNNGIEEPRILDRIRKWTDINLSSTQCTDIPETVMHIGKCIPKYFLEQKFDGHIPQRSESENIPAQKSIAKNP